VAAHPGLLRLGVTNARTEGFNRVIENVKRVAFNRPSGLGSTGGVAGCGSFEPVEVVLEAGDDVGVPGDLAVPAASLGVLAEGDGVGELRLELGRNSAVVV
jgi:hypothetical protein